MLKLKLLPLLTLMSLATVVQVGCSTRRVTTTGRTAVEQLLLSTAVDKALEKLDLPMVKGKKIFLDFSNLKATDGEYLQVALRAKMAREGSILAGAADGADYVIEVASGAMAMEDTSLLIGMPALPMPQSPVALPEVPLYKTVEQTAILKLMLFVHEKGEFVASDQYFARSDRDETSLMWYRFHRKDDVRVNWEHADARLAKKRQALEAQADAATEHGDHAPKPE